MRFLERHKVGIDLGTANTLVYMQGKGIVYNEPTVVAINDRVKRAIAIGREAKKMLGKTPPYVRAVRPLKDGVITEVEEVEQMLHLIMQKIGVSRGIFRPTVLIAIPSGITLVEKRAVRDSLIKAGARDVHFVPQPVAAAIGEDLPINLPHGNMIIDIGGGTTEVAVISLGGVVRCTSVRTAGDEMNEAIIDYLKSKYKLSIGEITAEEIKIKIGSAAPIDPEETIEVKGLDLSVNLPKTITVNSKEIREALQKPISEIVSAVKKTLEITPPQLASDIIETGITLVGGGALLRGMDAALSRETGLKIKRSKNPLFSVINGIGKMLSNFAKYRELVEKTS